jgi:hypothetical protein
MFLEVVQQVLYRLLRQPADAGVADLAAGDSGAPHGLLRGR